MKNYELGLMSNILLISSILETIKLEGEKQIQHLWQLHKCVTTICYAICHLLT